MTKKLNNLRNFGPETTKWLEKVGVYTVDDLKKWDLVDLYQGLAAEGFPVSRNFIWAAYGLLHGIDWREVPEAVKVEYNQRLEKMRRETQ